MAHRINGIVTSFKYEGDFPNVILVGNFHFIPLEKQVGRNYSDQALPPFDRLTQAGKKLIRDLSFQGKCCYIETDYFGGPGTQMAAVWENGSQIEGPLYSSDGINNPQVPADATVVEDAINQALQRIGIYRHEGKDEFDSVRLGWFRSNDDVLRP